MTRTLLAAAWWLGVSSSAVAAAAPPASPSAPVVTWSQLPDLPPAPGQASQPGLAGAFAGVHADALIVAGGANFPQAPPWQGGAKKWWDDIYVLVKLDPASAAGALPETAPDGQALSGLPRYRWVYPKTRLPHPLAYGAAVSTPDGVLCIGGCDAERCYADVFRIRWDPTTQDVAIDPLPPLPGPLAFHGAAQIVDAARGIDRVYVVGGQEGVKDPAATRTFLCLDLGELKAGREVRWQTLDPWPGPPRLLPVVAVQTFREDPCLYVFSGRDVQPGRQAVFLADAYRYTPPGARAYAEGRTDGLPWKPLGDIRPDGRAPRPITAGVGIAYGSQHILAMGETGDLFLKLADLETRAGRLRAEAEQQADPAAKAGLLAQAQGADAERIDLLTRHPGFSPDILLYHTVTDTWVQRGSFPRGSPVTTNLVRWGDALVIPSGEVSPGIRTAQVWAARPIEPQVAFGTLNWAALGAYLAVLVWMGVHLSRREKTTGDFFLAGRRIPWWAAGLSIYGTQLSAITFMAIPAASYRLDWVPYVGNLMIFCIAPVVVYLYLPFYGRLNVTSAYEYLEKRFNLAARLYGSLSFIAYQIGRMGIVILLPAVALSAVTGIDKYVCIVIMGLLCTFYTVLGGIEAVIWTDVLQVGVLLGGAVLSFFFIAAKVEGGMAGVVSTAWQHDKLHAANFTWDCTVMALGVVVFGNFLGNLVPYTTDQAVVQRYLTVRDETQARRAIWTNALLTVPGSILFFGIGTALFAFYAHHPGQLKPMLHNDAIFPLFIKQEFPAGLAGVVVAGVFAAAMSTLDSSMNSIATVVTTDFYRRFRPAAPDGRCLALARWITVAAGVLATGTAAWMAWQGGRIQSLFFHFQTIMGLIGGSLAGLFVLAIFTRRARAWPAVIGALAGAAGQVFIASCTNVHFYLYVAFGMGITAGVGYAASLLAGGEKKNLDRLTIYTVHGPPTPAGQPKEA
ncbi:MAG: sodium/solute symporter [Planctomycetes bacterium]|nr:sodium/solute symporter [Planctomycetota bacterium]